MYRYLLTIAVGMVLLPQSSNASTIYTNLGPDNTYFFAAGTGVTGTSASIMGTPLQATSVAVQFTPGSDYLLTEVDLALTNVNGTNGAEISLTEDLNGIPGDSLGLWTVTNLPAFGSTDSVLARVVPTSLITLVAGMPYWIVALPIAPDTYDVWNLDGNNGSGAGGLVAINSGSGFVASMVSADSLAYSVYGTLQVAPGPSPVPEPGTLSFAFLSFLGLVYRQRSRSGRA